MDCYRKPVVNMTSGLCLCGFCNKSKTDLVIAPLTKVVSSPIVVSGFDSVSYSKLLLVMRSNEDRLSDCKRFDFIV